MKVKTNGEELETVAAGPQINNTLSENDLTPVKQLGFLASLGALGYIFWVIGGMEMVERISYYGVKSVASLYADDPVSKGGLGIKASELAEIMLVFSLFLTVVPIVSGGISDRIGYKRSIFISTFIKISGYLTMAAFQNYWGFMFGMCLLALGTGIFKPGIQGTLVKSTRRENTTMAWGMFYQVVNIGFFIGPIVAGYIQARVDWQNVFYVCGAIISINFLFLQCYKEPGLEEAREHRNKVKAGLIKQEPLWKAALREVAKPIVFWYMIVFSGFWFLFNSLFDVLPLYIKHWVDTSIIVKDLFGGNTPADVFKILFTMDAEGTYIQPQGMVNINAALIMTTCFIVAALSSRYRITSSMLVGCLLSCAAIILVGTSNAAWYIALSIAIFSLGEMLLSPKKGELMGNIAPKDKKAMYLGFVMLPQAIGQTAESYIALNLYEKYASKDRFSRDLLEERGMLSSEIEQIPQGEAFDRLVEFTGQSPQLLTELLYNTHDVSIIWYIISSVGLISGIGIYLYGKWMYKLEKQQATIAN